MQFIDLFAGIGGFRLGMEMAGHECVGHCEIDKYAQKSYVAIHGEGGWFADDITRVTPGELPPADCYCAGFPCQSFSIAGGRGGFEDTRGTLFFEIMRLARERQPKYLLLENVKGLLSHDGGRTFGTILRTLGECGYDAEWSLLNTKDFSTNEWPTPQNRERVFIIGHLRRQSRPKVFPITKSSEQAIRQIGNIDQHKRKRDNPQTGRIYDPEGLSPTLNTMQGGGLEPKVFLNKSMVKIHPCLTLDRLNKKQNGRRFKEHGEPMFTLTAQDRHGVAIVDDTNSEKFGGTKVYHKNTPTLRSERHGLKVVGNIYPSGGQGGKVYSPCSISPTVSGQRVNAQGYILENNVSIRRLTPLECWRLQGFPDSAFYAAKSAGISDSQLYKQAGNAVTVNVVYEIAKRL